MNNKKKDISNYLRSLLMPSCCFIIVMSLLLFNQLSLKTEDQIFDDNLWDEDYYTQLLEDKETADSDYTCLLVYDALDEESALVYENVSYVLESLHVFVETVEIFTGAASDETSNSNDYTSNIFSLNDTYDDLVICTNEIASLNVMLADIVQWVSGGGHLMMAAGLCINEDVFLQQNELLDTWKMLLGLDDQSELEERTVLSLEFTSTLMPGASGMVFSDEVVSGTALNCMVTDDSTVHATDPENGDMPLIWSRKVENGGVAVCNADLMDSKSDRGIIVSLYTSLYVAFAYPVINAAVYCIDDFPSPIPAGYDENILNQYGYTVSDFLKNVWLPSMLEISEKYEIPYSAFLIQTYDDDVNGPFDDRTNLTDAVYYAGEILKSGGEIGIHGYNHQPLTLDGYTFDTENTGYVTWHTVESMVDSIRAALDYGNDITSDACIQAYIAPSNVISEEALEAMLTQIEDLRVYAGVYVGTFDQFVQEYTVLENGTVFFPRLTADMQMEDSEWWLQINELAFHYVESNFIHPDDILDEERSDGGDFTQMLEGYETMVSWNTEMGLQPCTISQGAAMVQRYNYISISQSLTETGMEITVSGFVDTAYVMLRTDGREPVVESGATIQKVDDGTYVLKISEEKVTIKWK